MVFYSEECEMPVLLTIRGDLDEDVVRQLIELAQAAGATVTRVETPSGPRLSETQHRLLEQLQAGGGVQNTVQLAGALAVKEVSVRASMGDLVREGLVERDPTQIAGARRWLLTDKGRELLEKRTAE